MQTFQAIHEILKTELRPEVRVPLLKALRVEGDSVKRLVDDIITCHVREVVPDRDEINMYRNGERINAITQLSHRASVTLIEAKKSFENFLINLSNEEIQLIVQGKYIDAIKKVRKRTDVGLVQAKFSVDCYDDGYIYLGGPDQIIKGDEYLTKNEWKCADNFIGQSITQAGLIAVRRRK